MSASRNDKIATRIRRWLRWQRLGRTTQRLQGEPMKNQSIALAVKEPYATTICENRGSCFASVQAVGRALGYTGKELTLANVVLKRFAWRYPAEPRTEGTEPAKVEPIDSHRDWGQVG